jgi:hypothetical protein
VSLIKIFETAEIFMDVSVISMPLKHTLVYVICNVRFLDYIKSCPDKCTPFIICYLIQFILKIVQHDSIIEYLRMN